MRCLVVAALGAALAGNLAFAAEAPVQATANAPAKSAFGPTAVGQKAAQFRADFEKLKANTTTRSAQLDAVREQTVRNVNAYHTLVGGIRSRLQMGSTPGNPELLAQWAQAQTQLTQIDADIATLNTLSAQVSGDAGTSSYLLENIRAAYGLSGALEEDHRNLRLLEDEVNQNAIVIDRALQNLNAEINRQQQYVTTERTSLVQLAADINAGQSFPANARRAIPARAVATVSTQSFADKKPLVVIKFDKPDVTYEPALYQALSRALERRPDAVFDLVAVSPDGGNPSAARTDADAVFASMPNMGLPAERVVMAAMGSNSAKTPEVHIYVH
ncbi:MAG: hypothetical protein K1X51_06880 [Rhodospirillaceae bacterium]|nr:hypothetical protein [Rhodospirillaceae bacterium]